MFHVKIHLHPLASLSPMHGFINHRVSLSDGLRLFVPVCMSGRQFARGRDTVIARQASSHCVLGNREGKVEHGAGRSRPGGDVRVRSEGKKGTVYLSIQDKNGETYKKYKDKLFFFLSGHVRCQVLVSIQATTGDVSHKL